MSKMSNLGRSAAGLALLLQLGCGGVQARVDAHAEEIAKGDKADYRQVFGAEPSLAWTLLKLGRLGIPEKVARERAPELFEGKQEPSPHGETIRVFPNLHAPVTVMLMEGRVQTGRIDPKELYDAELLLSQVTQRWGPPVITCDMGAAWFNDDQDLRVLVDSTELQFDYATSFEKVINLLAALPRERTPKTATIEAVISKHVRFITPIKKEQAYKHGRRVVTIPPIGCGAFSSSVSWNQDGLHRDDTSSLMLYIDTLHHPNVEGFVIDAFTKRFGKPTEDTSNDPEAKRVFYTFGAKPREIHVERGESSLEVNVVF